MTTVVAYATGGGVYMAADTCTNVYERPIPGGAKKLHRIKAGLDAEVLLGICGSGGLAGELPASLKIDAVPVGDESDVQAWAHAVAKAITELAVQAGLTENGKLDGHLSLGWGGRVWTISHAMAIPHPDGIAAIGSGEGPAIGALDALIAEAEAGRVPSDPERFVRFAAQVGIHRDRYSAGPVEVQVLPPSA